LSPIKGRPFLEVDLALLSDLVDFFVEVFLVDLVVFFAMRAVYHTVQIEYLSEN
jgi:hypothetical protein